MMIEKKKTRRRQKILDQVRRSNVIFSKRNLYQFNFTDLMGLRPLIENVIKLYSRMLFKNQKDFNKNRFYKDFMFFVHTFFLNRDLTGYT